MAKPHARIVEETLAFLVAHHLPPTPPNYALAYYALDAPGSPIGLAVAALIEGGVRIKQDQIGQLLSLNTDREQAAGEDTNRAALRHQTLKLGEMAASTAALTGRFADELAAETIDGTTGQAVQIVARMVARSKLAETQLCAAATEIEELRQRLEAAQNDAEKDQLTGLGNRRAIERHLQLLANSGERRAVAVCDIDHFKRINDQYGHGVGDRVLKVVASSLANSCAPHFVGRWGGEEFLVVMAGLDERQCAEKLDEAREALARREFKLRENDEPMGTITFSAGVASTKDDYAAAVAAIHQADAALYRAKTDGRNRVVCA